MAIIHYWAADPHQGTAGQREGLGS
jgi:hypothetical protein